MRITIQSEALRAENLAHVRSKSGDRPFFHQTNPARTPPEAPDILVVRRHHLLKRLVCFLGDIPGATVRFFDLFPRGPGFEMLGITGPDNLKPTARQPILPRPKDLHGFDNPPGFPNHRR